LDRNLIRGHAWVADVLARMRGRRMAVVGDIMLDEWLWGRVRRISPEAPVPVVEVQDHSYTLGGAGNVANNLAALGAKVAIIGVVGDDEAGGRVLAMLRKLRADCSGVERVSKRPTTQKTRIVAHNQQVVRADRESTQPVDAKIAVRLKRALLALDGKVDGIVVSDYGKGLITKPVVAALRAFRNKTIVAGDPKPQNLDAFSGIDCIAPNALEAGAAVGMPVDSDAELARAAGALLARSRCRYVLITRGEHGMTLFSKRARPFTVPAVARQVYDVSGAGDTVISTLALAMSVGATIEQAVSLASLAAGVVVEKLGTATATPREILRFAEHEGVAEPVPFPLARTTKVTRARR
jgi:D-beta-D-heptose 7-phosphate kinase/D-beta-D-heptose 1-phosphate adenosyltransferase